MLFRSLAGRLVARDAIPRGHALQLGALASSLLVERPGLDSVPTLAAVREREASLRASN